MLESRTSKGACQQRSRESNRLTLSNEVLAVNATHVVHSGVSGNNGGYHTNPRFWRGSRMRVHRNAKTTPQDASADRGREPQQGWTYRADRAALGISVRTVAKWIARVRQRGPRRMGRRGRTGSRADSPRRSRRRSWPCGGPAPRRGRSAWRSRLPRSTVTRVLARAGLESRGPPRAASRRCSAMSGRTWAICCTSI